MYVLEIHRNLTDEQIEFALGVLKKEMLASRAFTHAVDWEKMDSVITTFQPERDAAQSKAILDALNGASNR